MYIEDTYYGHQRAQSKHDRQPHRVQQPLFSISRTLLCVAKKAKQRMLRRFFVVASASEYTLAVIFQTAERISNSIPRSPPYLHLCGVPTQPLSLIRGPAFGPGLSGRGSVRSGSGCGDLWRDEGRWKECCTLWDLISVDTMELFWASSQQPHVHYWFTRLPCVN